MARTSSPHIGRIHQNRFEDNKKKKHVFRSGQARRIVEFVNVDKVEFVILYLFALPFWSRCLSTLFDKEGILDKEPMNRKLTQLPCS
jgi:hypothetical protein